MKKLVVLTVCLVAFAATGFAQNKYKGEKGVSSVGANVGYSIEGKAAVVGLDYRYNIDNQIRLAPSLLYTLESDDVSRFYINADAHYLVRITESATIYPLGGIGLSLWNIDYPVINADGVGTDSETKVRLGFNLGFGGETRISQDVIVGAEFRYHLTNRHYCQAMILVRAAYYW